MPRRLYDSEVYEALKEALRRTRKGYVIDLTPRAFNQEFTVAAKILNKILDDYDKSTPKTYLMCAQCPQRRLEM